MPTRMYLIDNRSDLSNINTAIVDGLLQIRPAEWYAQFDNNTIKLFMHQNGFYVLPTTELIDWLSENIVGFAIEIGAGNGAIARALKIPITDSYQQAMPKYKQQYEANGQPPIIYPKDVEKYTAAQALVRFRPNTVIGGFITHRWEFGMTDGNEVGVKEEEILQKVQRYINIGNVATHQHKPILMLPHETYQFDWLITRSANQDLNRIWIWKQ